MATSRLIQWDHLTEDDQVRRVVKDSLPAEPNVADVASFTTQQRLEHSDLVDGVIYCSASAPSLLGLLPAKWLIEFKFDHERLIGIHVEKDVTGP